MEFFTDSTLRIILGLVVGAIVGSFLNVCVTRVPQGFSIILPGSACPKCKKPIRWFNNLPIISWLYQVGKARCCDFKIPFRYFLVELFTALFFGYLLFGMDDLRNWGLLICGMVFVSFFIVIIAIDSETMTIPDRFSIGGALTGLIFSFCFPELHGFSIEPIFIERLSGLFTGMTGLLISSAILYWIGAIAERLMRKEALGQGDVKLLGLVGAFCGWQGGLFVIFGGALIGTALLIPVMVWNKFSGSVDGSDLEDHIGWGMEVPFGPFLGIAALAYFLVLQDFVNSWFDGIISNFMLIFSNL